MAVSLGMLGARLSRLGGRWGASLTEYLVIAAHDEAGVICDTIWHLADQCHAVLVVDHPLAPLEAAIAGGGH